jgi:hypothetical protein
MMRIGGTEKRREYYFAPLKIEFVGLAPELKRRSLRHLVRARLIRWGVSGALICLHEIVGDEKSFDFLAADVRQHFAVDLDTGAEHLPAFFDHLLALGRIVDDVAIFVGQIVFAHDRADALAPTASRFQVSDYFRFIHNSET